MTKKQKQEIDFLTKYFSKKPVTDDHAEDYIRQSVHGLSKSAQGIGQRNDNPLMDAKRSLDMMVKMWRRDLTIGLISAEELKEDFNHPFFDRVMKGILKSVTPDYRSKELTTAGGGTILSFTNFI